jgi:hypothetical protein
MHRYLGINLERNFNNTAEAVTEKAMSVYPSFVKLWNFRAYAWLSPLIKSRDFVCVTKYDQRCWREG